jgi:predicted membrane protein
MLLTSTVLLILFAILLFTGIFGNLFSLNITTKYTGYIGYGAYVMHSEGRLGKKKSKKLSKKDKVKGGSIFE